jgi:uncharacterized protein
MDRNETLSRLRENADAVRHLGATGLFLFGSTARNGAEDDSDIDLFIDYDPESRFNAFDLVGIKIFLEEKVGRPVDITTRDSLHPRLRAKIENSAIRVF